MDLTSKDNTPRLSTKHGEIIHELIGRNMGDPTECYSLAYVIIPPGKSSLLHYHPVSEEGYYLLHGKGRIHIGDDEFVILPGQAIRISPSQPHKIFNIGEIDLEFLAFCVPAWEPADTQYLETYQGDE